MSIPSSVTAALSALSSATTANAPLASQPRAIITSVQQKGAAAVSAIDAAILSAGALDGVDPTGMPQVIVTALLALATASYDQSALADMRGFVGRVAANLDQL